MGKRNEYNESDGNQEAPQVGGVDLPAGPEEDTGRKPRKYKIKAEAPVNALKKKRMSISKMAHRVTFSAETFPGNSDPLEGRSNGKATSAATEDSSVQESEDTSKKKKRKHKPSEPVSGDEATLAACPVAPEEDRLPKKKKKSKKLPKIVDPTKDKSLSEQALRALAYAYSQYSGPETWKFNKARQNWLTRNVWSSDTIPDEHLPLVTWYLKNVKGGTRDALIKTCQSYLSAPQPQLENEPIADGIAKPEPVSSPLFGLPPSALTESSHNDKESRRSRAQNLLKVLEPS